MDIQTGIDQVGRLIGQIGDKAQDFVAGGPGTNEPTVGELWEKASPDIEKALAIYDKMEASSTPETTWNLFGNSKTNCQRDLDQILDALLGVLGICGAAGYRKKIEKLKDEIAESKDRVGNYREKMLSAPSESSQSFFDGLLNPSVESLREQTDEENAQIKDKAQQIERLKVGFRDHLQQIGISVSPETADSFLLPVHNEIVSMAAVISNISRLTEQLQRLVNESRENLSHTKRYYGVYVLLVLAVDRIQKHFIREVDENYIPRLDSRKQEAGQIIDHAQREMSRGGLKYQLEGNITANRKNIHACQLMTEILRSHKRSIAGENRELQRSIGAAVNTYRTVKVSYDIVEVVGQCSAAFRALRGLRIPTLQTFKNVHLNEELQLLAEQIAVKE